MLVFCGSFDFEFLFFCLSRVLIYIDDCLLVIFESCSFIFDVVVETGPISEWQCLVDQTGFALFELFWIESPESVLGDPV
jgi:hypothetical protein